MEDVVIIGAGLAGITCGRYLQEQGRRVVLLEKSRGVGGRLATRRLSGTIADHGAKYLENQGSYTKDLIEFLQQQGLIISWANTNYEFRDTEIDSTTGRDQTKLWKSQIGTDRYVAPLGMSSIAKTLAQGLDIRLSHRVDRVQATDQGWQLGLDLPADSPTIQAKALVIAIPAPQALAILSPKSLDRDQGLAQDTNRELKSGLNPDFLPNYFQTYLTQLAAVTYDGCIAVMAGYAPELQATFAARIPPWQAVNFPEDPDLAWLGLDSSKRLPLVQSLGQFLEESLDQQTSQLTNPQADQQTNQLISQPVIVCHSTPAFAAQYLDHPDPNLDLNAVGQQLLDRASSYLLPELKIPNGPSPTLAAMPSRTPACKAIVCPLRLPPLC
ncbi:MAG: FAD-dependent oxidoreductase, partial [Coleofasciculaceae cyanobacterium SM2_1_6]|nr:FAD-dependent oxidoreductase [Coleofasciculaceae cyanobacterium SM2_1_6]